MLWIKSLHILFMTTWFAGLFYLPRLYVYHSQTSDPPSLERFRIMELRLFWAIMTPGALLTLAFGTWLWIGYGFSGSWLSVKLWLVALVVAYHIWCYRKLRDFRHGRNRHGPTYYRWMNEVPTVLLTAIIILAVVKPF